MRALTMKTRKVLAASVCILALVLLAPAIASAQVTIYHIRVTVSGPAGAAPVATYCDTGAGPVGCTLAPWAGFPRAVPVGNTLVLSQTGTTTPAAAPPGQTFIFGNFDTSDRVQPGVTNDCDATHHCQVKIELDLTNDGIVNFTTAFDDAAAGTELSRFNNDQGGNNCEGHAFVQRATASNYTLSTGYVDTVHGIATADGACNFTPTPFTNSATVVVLATGVGKPVTVPAVTGGCSTASLNCFDAGAIKIDGVSAGCTFTWGYWKNHGPDPSGNNTDVWPVHTLLLGTVSYNGTQLKSILDTPVAGNGLISLAHQLIAAKLNIANGANGSTIAATITAADALIGALVVPPVGSGYLKPKDVSALVGALDAFNTGTTGPGHCADDDSVETD